MTGYLPPLARLWAEPWRSLIGGLLAAFAVARLGCWTLLGALPGAGGRVLRPLCLGAGGMAAFLAVFGWHALSLVLLPVMLAVLSLIPRPPLPQSRASEGAVLLLLLALVQLWAHAFAPPSLRPSALPPFLALAASWGLGALALLPFLAAGSQALVPPLWAALGPVGALLLAAFAPLPGASLLARQSVFLALGALALAPVVRPGEAGRTGPRRGGGRSRGRGKGEPSPFLAEPQFFALLAAFLASGAGARVPPASLLGTALRLALFALFLFLFLHLARRWRGRNFWSGLAGLLTAGGVSVVLGFSAAALLGWR